MNAVFDVIDNMEPLDLLVLATGLVSLLNYGFSLFLKLVDKIFTKND